MADARTLPPQQRALPTLYRDVTIDRGALADRAAGEERIPVSMSSEYAVERGGLWSDPYLEVLDHSPDAVDLSRADGGLPLLLDHDPTKQIGVVEDVRLGADRVLRGMARFSRNPLAQEVKRDVEDGIKTRTSIGYRVQEMVQEKRADANGLAHLRATRWQLFENSFVSIPADPTVGAGRSAGSAGEAAHPVSVRFLDPSPLPSPNPAPTGKENTVSDENTAPAGGADTEQVQTRAAERASADVRVTRAERDARAEDAKEIAALAAQHRMTDKLPEWIGRGASLDEVRNEVIAGLNERLKRGPQFKPIVDMNEREEKSYSFIRAINSAASVAPSFEREVSEEIAQHLPQGYKANGGLFVPTNVRMSRTEGGHNMMKRTGAGLALDTRAGLDSATSTSGAELKQTQYGSFVEMLRNHARVMQAGATVLAGLDGPVSFPKQTSAGTASWMGENPGSPVTLSTLGTSTVSLSAKTVASQTKFSKQLLRQSTPDAEALVRGDLAAIHALAIDLAAIAGTGASNQPTGILSTSGIGSVAGGTNGLAPTYNHLVGLEYKVEQANANVGPMAYLTTPGIKGTLKTTQKFATTNGESVWTGGEEGLANGYRAFSSNQVPSTLTKGTSAGTCHAILFGVWSQLLIGEWGAMEILADPYTLAGYGMIQVTSFQMVDIAVRYAAAFAAMQDALSASF